MPVWAKNAAWLLVFLLLLANHRQVGTWLTDFGREMKGLFPSDLLHYEDPFIRFLLAGLLIVAVVGMFKIYWNGRPSGRR